MGFFDLFKGKKTDEGEQVQQAKTVDIQIPANKGQAKFITNVVSIEPDAPQPIGYKTEWIAVKNATPEQVIERLGLKNVQVANWESGMRAAREDKVFVTPMMDGYVIVTGMMSLEENRDKLDELGKKFDEVLFLATHRVVELQTWAKYVNGEKIRRYYYLGESGEVSSEGEITPEEIELGFEDFISSEDDDWDEVEFPDEESVMDISKAWGVDPWFEGHESELSTGYIADYE